MFSIDSYLTKDFFQKEGINKEDVQILWTWITRGQNKKEQYPLHYLACCMNFLHFSKPASEITASEIYNRIRRLGRNGANPSSVAWLALAMSVRYNVPAEDADFMSLKSKLEGYRGVEAYFCGLLLRLAQILSYGDVNELCHSSMERQKNKFILTLHARTNDSRVLPAKALFSSIGEMMRIKTEFLVTWP